jgi:hypothetical protein
MDSKSLEGLLKKVVVLPGPINNLHVINSIRFEDVLLTGEYKKVDLIEPGGIVEGEIYFKLEKLNPIKKIQHKTLLKELERITDDQIELIPKKSFSYQHITDRCYGPEEKQEILDKVSTSIYAVDHKKSIQNKIIRKHHTYIPRELLKKVYEPMNEKLTTMWELYRKTC